MAKIWEVNSTTAIYKDGDTELAKITGLKSGLTVNQDGTIDGITVDEEAGTIVLDKSVLGRKSGTVDSEDYTFKLAENCNEHEGSAWYVENDSSTEAALLGGTSESYSLDDSDGTITYKAAEININTVLATVSGLKSGFAKTELAEDAYEIDGLEVSEDDDDIVITVNDEALLDGDLKLTALDEDNDYTLAIGEEIKSKAQDPVWTVSKGTATCSSAMSAGYEVNEDGNTISKVDSKTASITISGLNTKATPAQLAEAFEIDSNTITVHKKAVLGSATKIGTEGFTFELGDDFDGDRSEAGEPEWTQKKGATSATYGYTVTGKGYLADGATITNYTKDSTDVTLVTVSGLPKNTGENAIAPDGLTIEEGSTVVTVDAYLLNTNYAKEDGVASLYKDEDGNQVYGIKKLSVDAKSGYTLALNEDVDQPEEDEMGRTWTFGSKTKSKKVGRETVATTEGTGTITLDLATSDGWKVDDSTKGASKTINYVAATSTNYLTISGLTTAFYKDDELNPDYELEKDEDKKYTGNILYVGGDDTEADADTDEEETKVYALKIDDEAKTVTLNESVFGSGKISIKNNTKATGETYALALDANYAVHDVEEPYWKITSAGKATLIGGKTEGYELDGKGGIAYTKAKETTLATITIKGYYEGKKVAIGETEIKDLAARLDEATQAAVKGEDGKYVIKLDSNILDGTNVESFTLDSKSDYKFELVTDSETESDNVAVYGAVEGSESWTVTPKSAKEADADKAKGTATYGATMQEGYDLSADGKTVTFKEEPKSVLFTLSGLDTSKKVTELTEMLNSGNVEITVDDGEEEEGDADATTVPMIQVVDKKVIINSTDPFGTNKISVDKNSGYTLNVDAVADADSEEFGWVYNTKKKTWDYQNGTTGGYALDAKGNGISASYTAAKANSALAAISGLSSDANLEDLVPGQTNRIVITSEMLENLASDKTTSISLTSDKYKLSLDTGVSRASSDYNGWTANGKGSATLTRNITAGWELATGSKVINYTADKENDTVVTLSGLNKEFDDELGDDQISIDDNGVITIKDEDILTTSSVSVKAAVKGETYTLALGDDITTAETEGVMGVTAWVNSKGTASLKTYNKAHYEYNETKNTIDYVKETTGTTAATIKGLAKETEEDINEYIYIDTVNNVITIDDAALAGANVTLTNTKANASKGIEGTNYKLDLKEDQKLRYNIGGFSTSGKSSVVLNAVVGNATGGYTVDSTGTKLTYTAAEDKKGNATSKTLATISGVSGTAGLSYESVDDEGDSNVIIVTEDALNKAKITLKSDDYTFQFTDVVGDIDEVVATVKSGTATINGVVGDSYSLSDDKMTINYTAGTKEGKVTALATVKGLDKSKDNAATDDDVTVDDGDRVVSFEDSSKLTTKVTVDSAYGFSFEFGEDYGNATITGGKNVDVISAEGSNLLINTSTGNDFVTFGESHSGNTFTYKVGDGNDTIENFDAGTDKITLATAGSLVTVVGSGEDAIVSITDKKRTAKTAGTITLTGMAGKTIDVGGSKYEAKVTTTPDETEDADLASSSDKIADNYFDASPQLGEILGTSYDAISADNFSATPDYTKLAQQQTVVYGTKK